jgi:acyl carrier protein
MTDRTPLRARITRLFSDTLQREVPGPDTDVFESGILDSLAFVDLLAALEREFGIGIALDDLEVDNFRSIARIAEFVAARTVTANRAVVLNFSTRAARGS